MAEEEKAQTEEFSLEDKLRSLDGEEMYDLVHVLMGKEPEVRRLILEWFKDRSKDMDDINTVQERGHLDEELLWDYWGDVSYIISEFNEYGGGSYEEEDEAYGWLDKILELAKAGNISTDAKFEFLDEAFKEYNIGNSGFEDALLDIFFELCETKEEWEYLVEKLGEHPTSWRNKQIMNIQKKYLRDEDAYLKMRMESLHYGMDYWDLVEFYMARGELQKARETSEEGILKGEGRLTELFRFLSDHFAEKMDTTNLKRIVHTALTRKTEEKAMLDRLFEYYKSQNDYENAKEALLKSYGFVRHEGYYAEYTRLKEFLNDSDWRQIEPEIFEKIREKNIHEYLQICLDKNMKKEVLDTILDPPRDQHWFAMYRNFDGFADKLKEDFPEEIIEYYWQKAYSNIPNGTRKTYSTAAGYLALVKHIYTCLLKEEPRWEQRFSDLKTEFKNRPAFLDEVRNV